jgi:uncharacterized protein YkwD
MKINLKYIFYVLYGFFAFFVITLGVTFAFATTGFTMFSFSENQEIEKSELFTLINEWRKENGYSEYQEHPFACLLAEERLPQVTKNWSHNGFLDSVSEIRTKFPETEDSVFGENLAKDSLYEQKTIDAWITSPSHLKNLEYDAPYSCIATDGNYVVHIFYKP